MSRVLIVEDYPSLQMLYKFALDKAGYQVDVCDDGDTALGMTKEHHYDVILLDLLLRQMSGLDFLRRYSPPKRHRPSAKIIVMSNIKHPEVSNEAERLGVAAFYIKSSADPKNIAAAVKHVLKGTD